MLKIKIILGSVRPGRAGKRVADWVIKKGREYQPGLELELVDLKEVNLPFLDEPEPAMMSSDYKHEHTKRWSRLIREADALVFITPEYNHGYSPVLKNAIDFLYEEWGGAPAGLITYGGGNGMNAMRQMREVMETVDMKLVEEQVSVSRIHEAFDERGSIRPENLKGDIRTFFSELEALHD